LSRKILLNQHRSVHGSSGDYRSFRIVDRNIERGGRRADGEERTRRRAARYDSATAHHRRCWIIDNGSRLTGIIALHDVSGNIQNALRNKSGNCKIATSNNSFVSRLA